MTSSTPAFIIVYFIYGFAFLSLGVALLLESRRAPSITSSWRLLPLSVFGILHGMHEWIEFFLVVSTTAGMPRSLLLESIRLILLVMSFASLLAYGVQELRSSVQLHLPVPLIAGSVLLLYSVLLSVIERGIPIGSVLWYQNADAFSRMFIAIPASLLAFFTLEKRSHILQNEARGKLAFYLRLTSIGFFLYAFTQVFVPAASVLYSPWLNAAKFETAIGFPIQVPRTLVAMLIAYALIQATQTAEEERQVELAQARNARIAALEQAQMETTKREELQQTLLHNIVLAQENERTRISRELHDETAQLLTALRFEVATIKNMVPNSTALGEHPQRIQQISKEISRNINRLVHQLRPSQLDDLGIIQALHFLADEAKKDLGLDVKLEIHGKKEIIPSPIETVVFRVAQESLTNVARHARISRAEIEFTFAETGIQLAISDKGVGFAPERLQEGTEKIGLLSMRERVEAVGGAFLIDSSSDRGTTITVDIPLPFEEGNAP